jgi:nucleoside 2-deoxyribosyltransferase
MFAISTTSSTRWRRERYNARMKCFISYKFTGEPIEDIERLLAPVHEALVEKGIEVHANLFDDDLPDGNISDKDFGPREYVLHAFKQLDTQDVMLVLLNSSDRSEGMLMEVGYALAKKIPVIVAVKSGVTDSYLPTMGARSFEWDSYIDLVAKIRALDFEHLHEARYT